MRFLLKSLLMPAVYTLVMVIIGLTFGMHAVDIWKWPVCALFLLIILTRGIRSLLPTKNVSQAEQELLNELKKLKDNATYTVPADNNEFIKWLDETGGEELVSGFKRVDPDKFKNMTIELASQDETDKRDNSIRILLSYIVDADIADTCLITDESCIFDFFFDEKLEAEAVEKINAILGKDIGITPSDYLWVAVDKIKKEFPAWPENKLKLVK